MLQLLSTGFIFGSGITLALSFLYFKYRIFNPYELAVTLAIDQSQENIEEQSKELQSYIDNREDIKNRLGDN